MNTRYQVLWDNRPSLLASPRRSKVASAAAPHRDPKLLTVPIGQIHSSQNGLFGHVDFAARDRAAAYETAASLRWQGYLGVTVWDTLHNPMSDLFPLG